MHKKHTYRFGASGAELDGAAALLRSGGLVAFPTETVYGLGARADDPLAVRGIYAAKGRPASNPLIVHVLGEAEARALVSEWPEAASALARAFWPGPLTLVLPRSAQVPDEVTAGGPTVAVRSPAHGVARELLARVGAAIAAPSANRAEHVSPTTAAHVLADLDGRIDAVVDGGACALGIESTVLALGPDGPRLLRAGSVSRAALAAVVGPVARGPAHAAHGAAAPSPGMQRRHYAPAGTVRLCAPGGALAALAALAREAPGARAGALCWSGPPPAGAAAERLPADAAGFARGLYAALRALEDAGCAAIVIEDVPDAPEWDAIRDRLHRAAAI